VAGGTPAWRGAGSAFDAKSAFDYVRSFVELKVPGAAHDNVSAAEDKAGTIQTALATLIGFAVDSMPADEAERVRARLRRSYVAALVNGVLQARTMEIGVPHDPAIGPGVRDQLSCQAIWWVLILPTAPAPCAGIRACAVHGGRRISARGLPPRRSARGP
jgi:hypothetical protein